MTGTTKERRALYWLPVILLPTGNVVAALLLPQEVDWRLWAVSLVGAVSEELFFRFFLLKRLLLPRMKPIHAVILVSALFAGMHLWNLRSEIAFLNVAVQMQFALCFSIWAGAVTWKSTWLIPLLAHVLLNMTATTDVPWLDLIVGTVVLIDGVLLTKE